MNVLQKLQSETIRSELSLMRMEAGVRSKILGILNSLEAELVTELTNADPTAPSMTAYKQARLTKLLKEVKTVTNTAYKKATVAATGGLEEAATAATKAFADSINFAVGAKIAKATIPKALMTKLVDNTLVETAPSADWWARQPKQLVDKFYDQMRVGLAKGDTLDQLIQRVRGIPAKNGQMAKAGIMDVSRRNAAALVRTATQSITNQARIEAMTANRDIVQGLQWLATLDNRTTEICRRLDGKVWRFVSHDSMDVVPVGHTNEYPGPTAHWGCRSVVLPWLKSWEDMAREAGGDTNFGHALDTMAPGTRSSLNGQIPAAMTYGDWLASLAKPEVVDALGGKENYALWEAGKIEATPELAIAQPPRIPVADDSFEASPSTARDSAVHAALSDLFASFFQRASSITPHVKSYTTHSKELNRWLSTGMDPNHYDAPVFQMRDKALREMFVKAPAIPQDVVVFSGIKGTIAEQLRELPIGSAIHTKRYVSSTLSGSEARTFSGDGREVIQLHVPQGARSAAYIDPVSAFSGDELEMLINRGSTFRLLRKTTRTVDGIDMSGNRAQRTYTIYIMELVE